MFLDNSDEKERKEEIYKRGEAGSKTETRGAKGNNTCLFWQCVEMYVGVWQYNPLSSCLLARLSLSSVEIANVILVKLAVWCGSM